MKEIRINMEEIVMQGDECEQDIRMVNSYPSKVTLALLAVARLGRIDGRNIGAVLDVSPVFLAHRVDVEELDESGAVAEVMCQKVLCRLLQGIRSILVDAEIRLEVAGNLLHQAAEGKSGDRCVAPGLAPVRSAPQEGWVVFRPGHPHLKPVGLGHLADGDGAELGRLGMGCRRHSSNTRG
jgi:hypothetical protein